MTEKERIHQLLKEYGYAAKKSFGQNFLIDSGIIRRIIDNLKPEDFDTVIEIGPGLGALTIPLSKRAKKLVAVDADREMIHVLKDILPDQKNLTLVQSDFLRFNPSTVSRMDTRAFIGNLPYNITSELFEYFLSKGFRTCGAMVQKEVADKLTYVKGKKDNSPLGAFIKVTGELSLVTNVDRSCFDPSPKVDSAFIRIDQKKKQDFKLYPIFKALFKDPNKTMSNCLKQYPNYRPIVERLSDEEKNMLTYRARQLEAEELLKLTKRIQSLLKEEE